jgi:hypothetical protein
MFYDEENVQIGQLSNLRQGFDNFYVFDTNNLAILEDTGIK